MIEIYHCIEPRAMASPTRINTVRWQIFRDEQYMKVAEIHVDDLELAFDYSQNIDRSWVEEDIVGWARSDNERSSSVGDIFLLNGVPFLVTEFGFHQV